MIEKLLPCPFCELPVRTERSVYPRLHRPSRNGWHVVCDGCELLFGYDVDYAGIYETEEEAIAAWNRRTLSKTETVKPVKDSYKLNEPLTLEELKRMDGEPVWVEKLDCSDKYDLRTSCWCLVYIEPFSDNDSFAEDKEDRCFFFREYGTTWLAYRHKKEEGE